LLLENFIRNLQGEQDISKLSVSFRNENMVTYCKALSETVVSCISIGQIQVCGTLLVAQLVEALRYKPEGRGFDSGWCHWNFSLK
jgi:hypothetical protein